MANSETILRDNEVAFILNDGTQVIMNTAAYLYLKVKNELPASVETKTIMPVNVTVQTKVTEAPKPAPAAPTVATKPFITKTCGVYAIPVHTTYCMLESRASDVIAHLKDFDFSRVQWFATAADAAYRLNVNDKYVSLVSCSWNRKFHKNTGTFDKYAARDWNSTNSKEYVFVKAADLDTLYYRVQNAKNRD